MIRFILKVVLKTRKWQDDKGSDRYSTEIHCNDFTFLSTKKESENNASNKPVANTPIANQQVSGQAPDQQNQNDDLPF